MKTRHTKITQIATVNGVDSVVLPSNPLRKALLIMYNSGNGSTFNFGAPASPTAGFTLSNPGPIPFILDIEEMGDGITAELHGIGNGGAGNFCIIEGFED